MLSQALTAKAMALRVGLQAEPVGLTNREFYPQNEHSSITSSCYEETVNITCGEHQRRHLTN